MTMYSDYDSLEGVIFPMENKILPIVHLLLTLTKTHPLFTLCVFGGKNGSTSFKILVQIFNNSITSICNYTYLIKSIGK